MKRTIVRTLTLFFLASLPLASRARAQQVEETIKVNVPFEFNIGRKAFPAGQYSLIQARPFLRVQDAQGRVVTTVLTRALQATRSGSSTRIEFETYGDQRVLTRVWQGESGYELSVSRRATAIAKQRNREVEAAEAGSHP
jgi:hypothetical protein